MKWQTKRNDTYPLRRDGRAGRLHGRGATPFVEVRPQTLELSPFLHVMEVRVARSSALRVFSEPRCPMGKKGKGSCCILRVLNIISGAGPQAMAYATKRCIIQGTTSAVGVCPAAIMRQSMNIMIALNAT